MKNLLVFIDGGQTGTPNSVLAKYRWPWTYAHGKFEYDYHFDIVLFNQKEPTYEGYFLATAEDNKTVVIHLVADERGMLTGRCCYIDDIEAMDYVNNPSKW